MADPLDDPALDLALRAECVDNSADVVDCDDLVDANLAGLDVDCDFRDLNTESQHLHPRGVRPACALAEDLPAFEQAGDLGERPRAPVCRDDLPVTEIEHPLLELEPLRGDLEDLPLG